MWLDRGCGAVRVRLSEAGKKAFGEQGGDSLVWYTGGPLFCPGRRTYLPEYVAIAYYESEICQYEFQKGTMKATPAVVAAPYGDGKVILMSPHAESIPGSEWIVRSAIKAAARSR